MSEEVLDNHKMKVKKALTLLNASSFNKNYVPTYEEEVLINISKFIAIKESLIKKDLVKGETELHYDVVTSAPFNDALIDFLYSINGNYYEERNKSLMLKLDKKLEKDCKKDSEELYQAIWLFHRVRDSFVHMRYKIDYDKKEIRVNNLVPGKFKLDVTIPFYILEKVIGAYENLLNYKKMNIVSSLYSSNVLDYLDSLESVVSGEEKEEIRDLIDKIESYTLDEDDYIKLMRLKEKYTFDSIDKNGLYAFSGIDDFVSSYKESSLQDEAIVNYMAVVLGEDDKLKGVDRKYRDYSFIKVTDVKENTDYYNASKNFYLLVITELEKLKVAALNEKADPQYSAKAVKYFFKRIMGKLGVLNDFKLRAFRNGVEHRHISSGDGVLSLYDTNTNSNKNHLIDMDINKRRMYTFLQNIDVEDVSYYNGINPYSDEDLLAMCSSDLQEKYRIKTFLDNLSSCLDVCMDEESKSKDEIFREIILYLNIISNRLRGRDIKLMESVPYLVATCSNPKLDNWSSYIKDKALQEESLILGKKVDTI